MDVSIIIVNYNTIDLIANAISSIYKFTKEIAFEIIVVDNNTQDLSPLLNINPQIRLLQLNCNHGFGWANNEGVKISQGRYVLFLNPDTLLCNNAIYILCHQLDVNEKYGVCGGNLFTLDKRPMHSYYYNTMSFRYLFKTIFFKNNYIFNIQNQFNFSTTNKYVDYITGADLMIRKDLFEKIGGFSKRIFMYFEDVDLCYKVRKKGFKVASIPAAQIIHLEGQSLNNVNDEKKNKTRLKWSVESRAAFLYENHTKKYCMLYFALSEIVFQLKFLLSRLVNRDSINLKKGHRTQKRIYYELKKLNSVK